MIPYKAMFGVDLRIGLSILPHDAIGTNVEGDLINLTNSQTRREDKIDWILHVCFYKNISNHTKI